MKNTVNIIPFLLAVLISLVFHAAVAEDNKYTEVMKKNIQVVYTAETIEQLQGAVNAFERVSAAEKTKWEPLYYAAFGYIMMTNQEKENAKKDAYLDLALKAIEKAKEIAPHESEIIALAGFAYMMRLRIDPATRGAEYAPLAMQMFGKAIELNSDNPRALVLMAQMQYGTAQFFGSSTTEACGLLKKSLEKFDTFKSDNPLAPQWGKQMGNRLKDQCN
jgi:tetratricopeptide (TPR) repeat protein